MAPLFWGLEEFPQLVCTNNKANKQTEWDRDFIMVKIKSGCSKNKTSFCQSLIIRPFKK
jgi:hypothetical protein